MSLSLLSLVILVVCSTGFSQDCSLYTTMELETALSANITGEPNTVCLSSGAQRDTYRGASVVVTLGGELRQVELQCTGSMWAMIANNMAIANTTSGLRRDCASCVPTGGGDASFDSITHCIPCQDSCTGLGLCTGFMLSDCCNYYSNDTCTRTCPTSTAADSSTNFTCIDPCANNPCSNGGNCTASGVEFRCACAGSWSGPTCGTCDVANCDVCSQVREVCSQCRSGLQLLSSGGCACTLTCGSGGVLNTSQCRCDCSAGYTGDTCGSRCTVENCRSCSNTSLDVCKDCVNGYELQESGTVCSRISGTNVSGLSLGAIIGIIIAGCIVLLLLLFLLILCCYCVCKRSSSIEVV